MFLGSVPSVEIAAMTSYSSTEKVQTETFYFDETILHESEHELFASHRTLFTTPSIPGNIPSVSYTHLTLPTIYSV